MCGFKNYVKHKTLAIVLRLNLCVLTVDAFSVWVLQVRTMAMKNTYESAFSTFDLKRRGKTKEKKITHNIVLEQYS